MPQESKHPADIFTQYVMTWEPFPLLTTTEIIANHSTLSREELVNCLFVNASEYLAILKTLNTTIKKRNHIGVVNSFRYCIREVLLHA